MSDLVIDPIGAVLAVLVLDGVVAGSAGAAMMVAVGGIAKTIFFGTLFGAAGAWLLVALMRRYWVPDHLHVPTAIGIAIAGFVAANAVQHEAGLLTVTLMGVLLANQKKVPIRHILEFKENLRILLISSLFILMSARIRLEDLEAIDGGTIAFVVALILVVRPLAVIVRTHGSSLTLRERAFLAWMAPRGIVDDVEREVRRVGVAGNTSRRASARDDR